MGAIKIMEHGYVNVLFEYFFENFFLQYLGHVSIGNRDSRVRHHCHKRVREAGWVSVIEHLGGEAGWSTRMGDPAVSATPC